MTTLAEQLQHLQDVIVVPREEDGTPARLLALMPVQPAVGDVAVACWADSDDGELIELVRLADGTRLDDQAALREALTLLAMVETVEELASFEELGGIEQELAAWSPPEGADLPEPFSHARERALTALRALAALAPEDPRMAQTSILDALGAALRELEQAWEQLERAAEHWSDAQLEPDPTDSARITVVQELWRVLSGARRGPLVKPVSTALHEGREAGAAMAAAIAEARTAG